jgi:site-specific recombinase XerD
MKIVEAQTMFMAYGRGERNYSPETLITRKGALRRWIVPILGDIEVGNLTRLDVSRLRTALIDAKIGLNHQYSIIMTLKVFCKFCLQVLKLNCLDPDREIPLPIRPKPFVEYLTNEEVARLRNAIETVTFTGLRMRTLVEVLLSTGLRISEALTLDRAPFEMGETEVPIMGKGRKQRVVYFPESTLGWVRRLLRFRGDDCAAVFVTTGIARRWDRNDLSKYFKVLRMKAGIQKPVHPQILRHTYCTNLRDHGTDITLIKELAGHQDIQTTAKYYLGVSKQALRDAVRKNLDYRVPEDSESDELEDEEEAPDQEARDRSRKSPSPI